MRIDENIKNNIILKAKKYFKSSHIYLFGSRVDDTKKGGDIDIFVDSSIDVSMEKQIAFLKDMYKYVTQRKIDLVVKTPFKKNIAIYDIAKSTGVRLC